jgi:exodeoxyribonuclease VIII
MIQNAVIVGNNITPQQYEAEDRQRGEPELVVRAHILSEILRNAQRWVKGYQSPASKSKEFGTLFDCLLLTPLQWPRRFAVLPADAPKKPTKAQINAKKPSPESVAAIQWWEEWTKENPGEIVSQDTNGAVHAALNRLRSDKLIADLIDTSAHAVMITAEWFDKPTGLTVPLKALLDIVPSSTHPVFSNSLWDLKTTQNASPRSFRMDAQKYGYAIQGSFYRELWNAATEDQRSDFGHVVMENYHPYEFRTPPPLMSQRFLWHGQLLYQRALGIYCQGLATGNWPSYDKQNGEWPLTDCDDWFLSTESLFDEIEEPAEESETEIEEKPDDLIP